MLILNYEHNHMNMMLISSLCKKEAYLCNEKIQFVKSTWITFKQAVNIILLCAWELFQAVNSNRECSCCSIQERFMKIFEVLFCECHQNYMEAINYYTYPVYMYTFMLYIVVLITNVLLNILEQHILYHCLILQNVTAMIFIFLITNCQQ